MYTIGENPFFPSNNFTTREQIESFCELTIRTFLTLLLITKSRSIRTITLIYAHLSAIYYATYALISYSGSDAYFMAILYTLGHFFLIGLFSGEGKTFYPEWQWIEKFVENSKKAIATLLFGGVLMLISNNEIISIAIPMLFFVSSSLKKKA